MPYRLIMVDGFDEFHADTLRDLHDETFGGDAPQINPEVGWWWLAHDGRELAGFCGLSPTDNAPRTIAYLKRAGVLLPHRGQGLQRRMVRVREMLARKRGFLTLVSDTTDNVSSANNLIACGYRLYRPEEPWAFNNSLYWYKDL